LIAFVGGARLTIFNLTGIVFCGGMLTGLVGSLTGLGGGIIITPLLTLLLGADIHYAIGSRKTNPQESCGLEANRKNFMRKTG
jgi:hypothetical protein